MVVGNCPWIRHWIQGEMGSNLYIDCCIQGESMFIICVGLQKYYTKDDLMMFLTSNICLLLILAIRFSNYMHLRGAYLRTPFFS